MTSADVDRGALRMAAEKVIGKAEEVVAVVTGDMVLRERAERHQVESGAPDVSATLVTGARKLLSCGSG